VAGEIGFIFNNKNAHGTMERWSTAGMPQTLNIREPPFDKNWQTVAEWLESTSDHISTQKMTLKHDHLAMNG
jgi:hypothetical protein